ncbi:MAG: hypothetical protein IJ758_02105 [Clostridia bacterium]|nr:hypothetical protein [Clostridia bacterium]
MDELVERLMKMIGTKENVDKIKNFSDILKNEENALDVKSIQEPSTIEENSPELPVETLSTVMKIMPIISSMNKEDRNTRFLGALRPLLSEKRQTKLDESVKMMQMMKILPLLKGQGLF